ncbi:hypothetical protein FGO68_gene9222 [Halteria grandinella]|uniref:Uncharacterized protein n=1 Tax=Halteria grandinella TaxID=5974 RepID=A0A8J8NTB7_HALGN|nr:hypothetical protein FGO68_gene9222 [Halteria grandinella]
MRPYTWVRSNSARGTFFKSLHLFLSQQMRSGVWLQAAHARRIALARMLALMKVLLTPSISSISPDLSKLQTTKQIIRAMMPAIRQLSSTVTVPKMRLPRISDSSAFTSPTKKMLSQMRASTDIQDCFPILTRRLDCI